GEALRAVEDVGGADAVAELEGGGDVEGDAVVLPLHHPVGRRPVGGLDDALAVLPAGHAVEEVPLEALRAAGAHVAVAVVAERGAGGLGDGVGERAVVGVGGGAADAGGLPRGEVV